MYDVVVAGARCAGASTALLLARAGYRVLLVDRARLPADTLSTLYVHQPGVARLARFGVLDALRATGAPPIRRALYRVADVTLRAGLPPCADGVRVTYAPRRIVLDALLLEAAAAAGARVRDGCAVVGLCRDGVAPGIGGGAGSGAAGGGAADGRPAGRVCGVRLRHGGGRVEEVRAALVVGADGMRSTVARLAGAAEYAVHPRMTCAYYTYWTDLPADFEQYQGERRWVGAMPTHDGLTLVAAYFPQPEFARIRRDAAAAYRAAIAATAPELWARMAAGRPAERLYGTGDQRNFLRGAAGPGWALVGDAGHHKDSITARGITDAFLQAELLAGCLTDGAGARLPAAGLPAGLSRYAARRDDLVRVGYQQTLAVGPLTVTARRLALLREVAASTELTARYFAAAAGIIDPPELFTGELVARTAAARPPPAGQGAVAWRPAVRTAALFDDPS